MRLGTAPSRWQLFATLSICQTRIIIKWLAMDNGRCGHVAQVHGCKVKKYVVAVVEALRLRIYDFQPLRRVQQESS